MLFNLSTVSAVGLASIVGLTQAMAVGQPGNGNMAQLDRKDIAINAAALICITPGSKKCGYSVTYTNGQKRETVNYQTGGQLACSVEMLRKHTNSDGFWANLNFIGSAGMNIGYNPSGQSIALGDADSTSNDAAHLKARCGNELGWNDDVDTDQSGESTWGNLNQKLY